MKAKKLIRKVFENEIEYYISQGYIKTGQEENLYILQKIVLDDQFDNKFEQGLLVKDIELKG